MDDEAHLCGRRILISGGTGSFGHAVAERLLKLPVAEVRVFSRDELKQSEMRRRYRGHTALTFFLGDVRDPPSVASAMQGIDYVFHAAALKQVPSCEFFPLEAVRTNVLGTANVIDAAVAAGVSKLVALSTDKAVAPTNAMGMSKALMEKVVIAKARAIPPGATVVCATRYGNVMNSRGSVIPLFLEQLRCGRAITLTDPRMTRFLMLLEESVDLVLHAFRHAEPGDIFVQKAPACSVRDLAEAVMQLAGVRAPIETLGIRHGEKLAEELVSAEEVARAQQQRNYYRIPCDGRDLNYGRYVEQGAAGAADCRPYRSDTVTQLSVEEIGALLRRCGLDWTGLD